MDLEQLLPQKIMFSLKDLQDIGFMKATTAKKFIHQGSLKAVRIGTKFFILRPEVIRYFNDNIVKTA